ncbi:MAG: hypothetical protein K2M84_04070, partial [Anaeroplasmataceae bacterium]|nr:hypothetical protein [Anaeroplasmataceae bacterium]
MIKINKKDQNIFVYHNQEPIGFIHYFTNVFHKNNLYLEFHLKEYKLEDSQELFKEIEHSFSMPLQVMLYEDEVEIIRFLMYAGFELKRKCYEYVVGKKDVKKKVFSNGSLEMITYLDSYYKFCVENLYNKYKENHKAISPLTAT